MSNNMFREEIAEWSSENIVEVECHQLLQVTETICTDEMCRYPQLALRILIHVIAGIDKEGGVYISAKQLANKLGVNYNTVSKCLKYLRKIGVLKPKKLM